MLSDNGKRVDEPEIFVASEDGALACLYGRIDIDSSPALRERLLALLQGRHPSLVSIDLSGVTHIDSSGVATLIEALKICLLYTSDAADERSSVDLGGRR